MISALEPLAAELTPHERRAFGDRLRAIHAEAVDWALERGYLSTRAANSPTESDGLLYFTRSGRRALREHRLVRYRTLSQGQT